MDLQFKDLQFKDLQFKDLQFTIYHSPRAAELLTSF